MPRRPTQSDFARLTNGTRRQIDRAVSGFADGKYDAEEMTGRMSDILANRHARAVYLGRRRAGDFSPFEEDDRLMAEQVMQGEDDFLARFAQDILNGRYGASETLNLGAIRRRAAMYTDKLLGTSNEAFSLASDVPIYWILGAAEEHCEDCPRIARNGPYTDHTLPTYPKAGHTECVMGCKCHLKREDGIDGFRAVD